MARYFGAVGYGESVESPAGSGIWVERIVERSYYGDVVRNTRKMQEGQYLNDDISVGNSISIVADAYATQHFMDIKYVEWAGYRWKVTEVEVQQPRLLLKLGGVYHGPTA